MSLKISIRNDQKTKSYMFTKNNDRAVFEKEF